MVPILFEILVFWKKCNASGSNRGIEDFSQRLGNQATYNLRVGARRRAIRRCMCALLDAKPLKLWFVYYTLAVHFRMKFTPGNLRKRLVQSLDRNLRDKLQWRLGTRSLLFYYLEQVRRRCVNHPLMAHTCSPGRDTLRVDGMQFFLNPVSYLPSKRLSMCCCWQSVRRASAGGRPSDTLSRMHSR